MYLYSPTIIAHYYCTYRRKASLEDIRRRFVSVRVGVRVSDEVKRSVIAFITVRLIIVSSIVNPGSSLLV